jgi:hypothetical protein
MVTAFPGGLTRPLEGISRDTVTQRGHQTIPIRLMAPPESTGSRKREPVSIGLPLPQGACLDPGLLSLADQAGRALPLQVRVLERWPDQSVKWALVDFQADLDSADSTVNLRVDSTPLPAAPAARLECRAGGEGYEIDTGVARFTLRGGTGAIFHEVSVGGRSVIDPQRSGLVIEHESGLCRVVLDRLSVDEPGNLRAVIRAEGHATVAASRIVDVDMRLHFFAGSPTVRIAMTLRNPRAAQHPGGFWELGDAGSVMLRDVSFTVAVAGHEEGHWWCSEAAGGPAAVRPTPFELYQESSGGQQWNHANHRNRHGAVPLTMRGYRARTAGSERHGERATPIVGWHSSDRSVTLTLPAFWENFPKAVEASGRDAILRVFPRQFPDLHELQGGEQKTHTFYVAFGSDHVTPAPLEWCRSPIRAAASPEWYGRTGAVPHLVPRSEDTAHGQHSLVDLGLDAKRGFLAKRDVIDEYGWRNFGDLYADHESALHSGAPFVSHYNNQYDAIAGFAGMFMRTGDHRWWTLMDDLARHVADIDVYHTDGDKSAYNGGLFWHTSHYVDAGRSTHRSFPRAPKVGGGGMANEHNYASGLALHYYLTGDPVSREAAIGLARWVVAMDDGRQTVFRWLARGATGLASQTSSPDYHGPGRGAGNSVRALIDGHRLTGDPTLLTKSEELIRRVIHPDDDLEARQLLDTERRWSYTAFLQALGVFLHYKTERREFDSGYVYARASLLHYARWMVEHEYPYLDKPELLEYPTETWAAQDLRKSDVLYYASLYGEGEEECARFSDRAAYFFHTAIATLTGLDTRWLTRPLVLLLSHGTLHAWMRTPAAARARNRGLMDVTDFGPPVSFTPQKTAAIRRFRRFFPITAMAGLALLFWWLLR